MFFYCLTSSLYNLEMFDHFAFVVTNHGIRRCQSVPRTCKQPIISWSVSPAEGTTQLFIYLSYLPNPSARAGYDTRSIFMRSLTGLNSEFSFS